MDNVPSAAGSSSPAGISPLCVRLGRRALVGAVVKARVGRGWNERLSGRPWILSIALLLQLSLRLLCGVRERSREAVERLGTGALLPV